jgi:PKD repeat protein
MQLKRNLLLALLVTPLMLLVASTIIGEVFAVPRIYVDPSISSVPQGSNLIIDIQVADVSELFTWQLNMTWDASIMNVSSVTEGDFLKAGLVNKPTSFTGAGYVNQTAGYVFIGCTILGADWKGTSGSGTLATFNFTVFGKGESDLTLSNIKLLNVLGGLLSYTKTDGFFTNLSVPAVALFTYSPLLPRIGETVTFNASASYDSDGEITGYAWDFGDGTGDTGMIVEHSYENAGGYLVKLTVTDNIGLNSTKTVNLRIRYTHDISIVKVSVPKSEINIGDDLVITAIAFNAGTETETFTVTFYYADYTAGTSTATDLAPDANATLNYTWKTADVAEGTYKIKAVATAVSGEINTADNALADGTVTLKNASQPIPWTLIGAGVGVAAVVCIAGFWFLRRRGSSSKPEP